MPNYHLATFSIAVPKKELTHRVMRGFVVNLDKINQLAKSSPGHIWTFANPDGPDGPVPGFEDEFAVINMSVWESIEQLKAFVYTSKHGEFFRKRNEWFEKMAQANLVLWWVETGHLPDTLEAKDRLQHLRKKGPTAYAFTFKQSFEPE